MPTATGRTCCGSRPISTTSYGGDDGQRTAQRVFVRAAAREFRPYLGDTWSFACMDRLIRADTPLRAADPAGDQEHLAVNGIDRWIGGVHLRGRDVAWRFDEGTETIRCTR